MTASVRTVCADILRNTRPTELYQYHRRCQGANLLDYVDVREAVELADECADAHEVMLVEIADLEETNGELSSENNKLLAENKALTAQVALTALRGIASGELS